MPQQETLYTELDAISHALESLWNHNKTPLSEAWAWQALKLASQALPQGLDALLKKKKTQPSLIAIV